MLLKNREHKWKTCSSWFLISVSLILGLVILNKAGHVSIEIIFLFCWNIMNSQTRTSTCVNLADGGGTTYYEIFHTKNIWFSTWLEKIFCFLDLNFLQWKWNVLFFHPENLFSSYVQAYARSFTKVWTSTATSQAKNMIVLLHHVSVVLS